jgi:hypothetical protein
VHRRLAIAVGCAVALSAARTQAADAGAPAPGDGADVGALAELVNRTPARDVPLLVASDPRFAALDPVERLRLLDAARSSRSTRTLATVLNLWPSFGVGSLVQGDWVGAATVAGGEFAGCLLIAGAMAWNAMDGAGPGPAFLATAGMATFVVSMAYGVVRPWRFEGPRHDALRQALFPVGPAQVPVRPVGLAPAAPPPSGATVSLVALRF